MLLAGLAEADFTFLLNTLGLTRGNLSAQSAKLEEAGYVEVSKGFAGRVPRTTYRLTPAGQAALDGYWKTMDTIRQGE